MKFPIQAFGPKAGILLPKILSQSQKKALEFAADDLMHDPFRQANRTVGMTYKKCKFSGKPSLYTIIPMHGETLEVIYRLENETLVIALIKFA